MQSENIIIMHVTIFQSYNQPTERNEEGKKRRAKKDLWDKEKRKRARNSSEAHGLPAIVCNHKASGLCSADELTAEDVQGRNISFHCNQCFAK